MRAMAGQGGGWTLTNVGALNGEHGEDLLNDAQCIEPGEVLAGKSPVSVRDRHRHLPIARWETSKISGQMVVKESMRTDGF